MLLIAFLVLFFCHGLSSDRDTGTVFYTAFPENVAFYDPVPHNISLLLTAMYSNTNITVTIKGINFQWTNSFNAGVTFELPLPQDAELQRERISNKTVMIQSNSMISVLSVTRRQNRIQTKIVPPWRRMGTSFHGPASIQRMPNVSDPLYSMKVTVINTVKKNTIKVLQGGVVTDQEVADSYQIVQFNITGSSSDVQIKSQAIVAVLISHPCLEFYNCSCYMAVIQLQPDAMLGNGFVVPPIPVKDDSDQPDLLVISDQRFALLQGPPLFNGSVQESSALVAIDPALGTNNLQLTFSTNTSLVLIGPYFIINVIPQSSLGACFLVHAVMNSPRKALLIVDTNQRFDVHLGKNAFSPSLNWVPISGTNLSWTVVQLNRSTPHIIWHPSTQMAVYVSDSLSATVWNAAINLSEQPDYSGCSLKYVTPFLLNVSGTWAESLHNCISPSAEMLSISNSNIQQQMAQNLEPSGDPKEAWIGLRRRLLNEEWYWLNRNPVVFTNWAANEPKGSMDGMCATVSLGPSGIFSWHSRSCCLSLQAICTPKKSIFSI